MAHKEQAGNKPLADSEHWELVAQGDWLTGQRFSIPAYAILGRDANCDITIPGKHLSRNHAELAIKDNKLLIRDLKSANGTFVNEQKITETQLKPGDIIRFDVLTFRVSGPTKPSTVDANATMVRPIAKASNVNKVKTNNAKHPQGERRRHPRPEAAEILKSINKTEIIEEPSSPLWTIFAGTAVLATLAAIGYLLTQL